MLDFHPAERRKRLLDRRKNSQPAPWQRRIVDEEGNVDIVVVHSDERIGARDRRATPHE